MSTVLDKSDDICFWMTPLYPNERMFSAVKTQINRNSKLLLYIKAKYLDGPTGSVDDFKKAIDLYRLKFESAALLTNLIKEQTEVVSQIGDFPPIKHEIINNKFPSDKTKYERYREELSFSNIRLREVLGDIFNIYEDRVYTALEFNCTANELEQILTMM